MFCKNTNRKTASEIIEEILVAKAEMKFGSKKTQGDS
jgi:hypothetical protein